MKIIKQSILFVFTFVLVLIIAEIFIKYAKISEVSFAEYYEDIGKGLAPANTYVFFNEGFGITSTNALRYIGKEVPLKKEDNTIRIALMGDSYVESIQIFERHYFGNILKEILNKKFAKDNLKIEVLNFGRSGFNIGNMYAYQRLFVDKFKPDYVLYFLSNDDLTCDYSIPPLLPITTIENGELKVSININDHDLKVYNKTKFLTQNSTISNILNFCRKKILDDETLPIILDKFYTKKIDHYSIDQEFNNENSELDSITNKIITNLDSNTIIVNRDNYPLFKKFKNLSIANHLLYIELIPVFDSLKKSGIEYDKWNLSNQHGHWNQITHRAVGVYLADQMHKKLLRF